MFTHYVALCRNGDGIDFDLYNYHPLEEIEEFLSQLEDTNENVELEKIAKTYRGNNVTLVKIRVSVSSHLDNQFELNILTDLRVGKQLHNHPH